MKEKRNNLLENEFFRPSNFNIIDALLWIMILRYNYLYLRIDTFLHSRNRMKWNTNTKEASSNPRYIFI